MSLEKISDESVINYYESIRKQADADRTHKHQSAPANACLCERTRRLWRRNRSRIERFAVISEGKRQIASAQAQMGMDDVSLIVTIGMADHIGNDLIEHQMRAIFGLGIDLMALQPRIQPVQALLQSPEIVGDCDRPLNIGAGDRVSWRHNASLPPRPQRPA